MSLSNLEQVIVVTPKGHLPNYIYQAGKIVEDLNDPVLPKLTYHYGHLVNHSDSEEGDYDRVIVTTRALKQGQILECKLTDDFFSMYDAVYGKTIIYRLTYDCGNINASHSELLERYSRGLSTTRKNIRRYFDQISNISRFDELHLSWFIPRY